MRLFGGALAVSFFLLFFLGPAEWELDWLLSSARVQMSTQRSSAQARLKLPADFPTGLPAPLAATLEGGASEHRAFSLRAHSGKGTPVLAQLDALVRSVEVVDEGPVFATLKVNVLWTSSRYQDSAGQPQPIVEENSTIRVFRSSQESQCLDFEIALKPLVTGLRLGGAENSRGYSGFTVRVKPPLEGVLHDQIGTLVQDRIGEASPWADYSGRFGAADRVSGIAILSHPSLPEFPPKWVLRHYRMVNVAYPGRHAVAFPQESLLVLRHRVVVHRGTQSQARIPDHQKIYETAW